MSQDRRTSYRCPVGSGDEVAIIRTKRRDLVVRVLDESAGGISILTDQANQFQQGDLLSIAYNSSCFEVRVAHLTEREGTCQIGLERRGELKYLHSVGMFHGMTFRDFTASFGLLAVTGAILLMTWKMAPDHWKSGLFSAREAAAQEDIAPEKPAEESREKLLAAKYLRLSDARSPRFAQILELTTEQTRVVHLHVEQTSRSIAGLYRKRTGDEDDRWIDASLDLIHKTWWRIEQTMNDEQRERFANLLREAESRSQQARRNAQSATAAIP